MSDLDRQIAADPRHPCSATLRRALKAEAELRQTREALAASLEREERLRLVVERLAHESIEGSALFDLVTDARAALSSGREGEDA